MDRKKVAYFLARAFMSQSQEVRVFIRPVSWSAHPLFGSGIKMRMRNPAVKPNIGETLRQEKKRRYCSLTLPCFPEQYLNMLKTIDN